MFIDYHTHHVRCGHAKGELEEYVRKGIEIGLKQLGLSDHMPLIHVDPATYYEGMAMPLDELPRYVEECLYLKEKYRDQIEIRVGLEGDYIEGYEEEIARIVSLGLCHRLGSFLGNVGRVRPETAAQLGRQARRGRVRPVLRRGAEGGENRFL